MKGGEGKGRSTRYNSADKSATITASSLRARCTAGVPAGSERGCECCRTKQAVPSLGVG